MTTISELFHQRRSRLSRNDVDSDLDLSPVDRVSHHHIHKNYRRHHHNSRRGLHGLDGCDTVRRSPQLRYPIHRPSVSEHDSIRLDEGSGNNASRNIANLESTSTMSSRQRFNDRLPGAVILARERLLQRLRGVSLSGNRFVDAGDWESEILGELPGGFNSFPESNTQIDSLLEMQRKSNQSVGLSQCELDCLNVEIFGHEKTGREGFIMKASQDCSICLESFKEGDKLTCLPCGHRFHSSCLDPWIQICSECPYCRTRIVVMSVVNCMTHP